MTLHSVHPRLGRDLLTNVGSGMWISVSRCDPASSQPDRTRRFDSVPALVGSGIANPF